LSHKYYTVDSGIDHCFWSAGIYGWYIVRMQSFGLKGLIRMLRGSYPKQLIQN